MFLEFLALQNPTVFIPVVNGILRIDAASQSLVWYLFIFVGLIMAISIHEFAHAYAAHLLGDDTAKMNGRMTINPAEHFDMLGFVLILLAPIGYGKPVPVNPNNFKNPVFGNFMVSLAGPASNILQAAVLGLLYLSLRMLPTGENILTTLVYSLPYIGALNISLAVFNMLPIPPLDGSKIWGYVHPAIDDLIYKSQPYSLIILAFLILTGMISILIYPFTHAYAFILSIPAFF